MKLSVPFKSTKAQGGLTPTSGSLQQVSSVFTPYLHAVKKDVLLFSSLIIQINNFGFYILHMPTVYLQKHYVIILSLVTFCHSRQKLRLSLDQCVVEIHSQICKLYV